MPRIDPELICHRLTISPKARLVSQRKKRLSDEKRKVVVDETKCLVEAGFIREIEYPTWLANVVLVQKSSRKWTMCSDYIDLNKACPKDAYLLPSIDRLVDGASGYQFLSFMDAYLGYNQIRMYPFDAEKMTFMTKGANYYYEVMPFRLKNAGATYQRLMDKIFADQMGRNMEAYVDDMVVKSRTEKDHLADLQELFDTLARYSLKLNPEKCSFGLQAGKFLGFMLTGRGIEANPDKYSAIINMRSPTTVKEVPKLTGRVAALARFLSKLGDRAFPFYWCLKKNDKFQWTDECEEVFLKLKEFLATPLILTRPDPGKTLYLYLSITDQAVSAILVQESRKDQQPIYFMSKVLHGAKTRYQKIEKLGLALVVAARRLRPYFQCHPIVVRTDQPVRQVLQKPDLAGRMVGWSVELSELGL